MPLTYTGRTVNPGNGAHPSLIDIAVGLSRQPRFAGQTRRWWSVLDHTLFGDELIKQDMGNAVPLGSSVRDLRLAWLLHDAHEAITADVPTDVKKDTLLGQRQDELDMDIARAFYPGGIGMWPTHRSWVKNYDRRCLLAEAHVVGPPAGSLHFDAPDQKDTELLQHIVSTPLNIIPRVPGLGVPPSALGQHEHPAVREYLNRMLELL